MGFYDDKIFVRGLMVDCPIGTPLENCPLSNFRLIPFRMRMRQVDKMSEERVQMIIDLHKQCLDKRESKPL